MIDSTYKRCFKCKYFSRDTRNLIYRKKFKFLRIKYWCFLLSKLNFWSIGRCHIALIDDHGEHINTFMRGYESCIFIGVTNEIMDAKDFVGKISDDPSKIEESIIKIENSKKERL